MPIQDGANVAPKSNWKAFIPVVMVLGMLAFVAFMIYSFATRPARKRETKEFAEVIYINEACSVSYLARGANNTMTLKHPRIEMCYPDSVVFYDDVPEGDKNYVVIDEYDHSDQTWTVAQVHVHTHKVQELEPGEWNHGQFGHGHSQKVE